MQGGWEQKNKKSGRRRRKEQVGECADATDVVIDPTKRANIEKSEDERSRKNTMKCGQSGKGNEESYCEGGKRTTG